MSFHPTHFPLDPLSVSYYFLYAGCKALKSKAMVNPYFPILYTNLEPPSSLSSLPHNLILFYKFTNNYYFNLEKLGYEFA